MHFEFALEISDFTWNLVNCYLRVAIFATVQFCPARSFTTLLLLSPCHCFPFLFPEYIVVSVPANGVEPPPQSNRCGSSNFSLLALLPGAAVAVAVGGTAVLVAVQYQNTWWGWWWRQGGYYSRTSNLGQAVS